SSFFFFNETSPSAIYTLSLHDALPIFLELDEAYEKAMQDPIFTKELDYYLQQYVGRETPLYHAKNLSEKLGGPQIYLKREDLNHTGAHKINNTIGQALLAARMGKKKIV